MHGEFWVRAQHPDLLKVLCGCRRFKILLQSSNVMQSMLKALTAITFHPTATWWANVVLLCDHKAHTGSVSVVFHLLYGSLQSTVDNVKSNNVLCLNERICDR